MASDRTASFRITIPCVLAAAMFASCAATVKIKSDPASVSREALRQTDLLRAEAGPPPAALANFADGTRRLIENAKRAERSAPFDAAAFYLKSAVDSHRLLAEGTEPKGSKAEQVLVDLHDHSLSRFVEIWMNDPRRIGKDVYRFDCEGETLEIRLAPDSDYQAGYFDRAVAALSLKDQKGIDRQTRDGYGAALVGIREQRPERADEMKFYSPKGLHVPTTLTIDRVAGPASDGLTRVTLSLRDPLQQQSITVGKRSYPLAADFSAPIAVILNHQSEAALGLEGFFKAATRAQTSGIYLTEPYDPDRIPVLLIHGLISVPMIWRDMVPQMMSEPDLSKRYQFMVFRYPSGYPIVESAQLLRDSLAELRAHYDPDGNDPLSRNMVVAGHSMGGILTHTLVVEMGDHLWKQINPDTPFDALQIDPRKKAELRERIFYEPDPAVWRAVYFSAPHRGARMAEKGIAGLVSRAARLPGNVLSATQVLMEPGVLTNPQILALTKGTFTSAQSLRPGAPMVAALDVAPYRKGVKYHSIMGDRGKGDTPNSSDGVVEYWSSHQEGAESELIVPTDHGSYKHPRAIEELKRILREHAGIQ